MCSETPLAACVLPNSARAPTVARQLVRDALCRHHGHDVEPDVMLLASALVTDALLAGDSPLSMTLECRTAEIKLVVSQSATVASRNANPHRRLSMMLLNKIAWEWGFADEDSYTTNWCAVPTLDTPWLGGTMERSGLNGSHHTAVHAEY